VVVQHDLRLLHEPQGAQGEQLRIARPRADERDAAAAVAARRRFEKGGEGLHAAAASAQPAMRS
jgi:hypothetical protein